MTLKIFPFEHLPAILKMIQFSYRLLEFSTFFFAFVVAVNLKMLVKKIRNIEIITILIVLVLLSLTLIGHLPQTDELNESRLIETVPVTENTGRVHAGCASFEYLPSKAFENRKYLETRENRILVQKGNAQIIKEEKNNTNLTCQILEGEEGAELELPYIYYLGYTVTIEENGTTTKLKTYETQNGFVGITIPKTEQALLKVKYEGTVLMKLSFVASLLGAIFLFLWSRFQKRGKG